MKPIYRERKYKPTKLDTYNNRIVKIFAGYKSSMFIDDYNQIWVTGDNVSGNYENYDNNQKRKIRIKK